MVSTYHLIKLLHNANLRKANRKRNMQLDKKIKKCVPSAHTFNSHTCRVCLQQGVIPIFSKKNSYDLPLSYYLKVICEIDITANDTNPQYLCKPCSDIVDATIKLRNTAKVTQSKLQEIRSSRQYTNNSYNETDNQMEYDPEVPILSPQDREKDTKLKLKGISLKNPNKEITIVKEGKKHIEHNPNELNLSPQQYIEFQEDKPLEKYFKQVFTNENKPLFQCLICEKVYKKGSTAKHLIIHLPDPEYQYVCEVCGKTCKSYGAFNMHRLIHSNELPFKCNLCPYKGRYNTQLQGHIQRVHIRKYKYKCMICLEKFVETNALRRHLRRHGEPKYRCTTCQKLFYEKSALQSHTQIHQMGVTTLHNCDICGNTYKRRNILLVHQIKAHKRKRVFNNRANYLKLENATVQLQIEN